MSSNAQLITVIIPIYNVEKFLAECIDSVIRQTYKNLEIILVDDGSPDNSGKIADEYAKKDKRISVIHKKNGGLFDARNAGLKKATGDFLFYLDSDDYLSNDCLQLLHDVAEKNHSDIVIGETSQNPNDLNDRSKTLATENHTSQTALEKYLYMRIKNFVAAKLYRTSTVKKLVFPALKFAEDQEYNYDAIALSKTITSCNATVYYYRDNPESLTRAKFNTKRMLGLTAVGNNLDKSKKANDNIYRAAKCRMFMEAFFILETIYFSKAQKTHKAEYERAKQILKKYTNDVISDKNAPKKPKIIAAASKININLIFQSQKTIKSIRGR